MCTQNERFSGRISPHTNLQRKQIFLKMFKKADEMQKNRFQNVCMTVFNKVYLGRIKKKENL